MDPADVLAVIQSVRDDFSREEDQGLLQDNLHKAQLALAGKWACDRIQRALELRLKLAPGPVRLTGRAR
jgi:hypothetical protein